MSYKERLINRKKQIESSCAWGIVNRDSKDYDEYLAIVQTLSSTPVEYSIKRCFRHFWPRNNKQPLDCNS